MLYLSKNIRALRKKAVLTQEQLAQRVGVKRSALAAYEEQRAEPRLQTLLALCQYFSVGIDDLINRDLSTAEQHTAKIDVKGDWLRVLPVLVDKEEKELATLVPIKAAAGYANGYGDVEFIETLPKFSLPFNELPQDRSYRVFQIKGESMLPVPSEAYIFCSYLQDWESLRNDHCYVLVTRNDGVVYKRVVKNLEDGMLSLKSDNPDYEPYVLPIDEVAEIWTALGYATFNLPEQGAIRTGNEGILEAIDQLKAEVKALRK